MMTLPVQGPAPMPPPPPPSMEALIQQLRAPAKRPGGIAPMPGPGLGPPAVAPGFRGRGKAAMAPNFQMARR